MLKNSIPKEKKETLSSTDADSEGFDRFEKFVNEILEGNGEEEDH